MPRRLFQSFQLGFRKKALLQCVQIMDQRHLPPGLAYVLRLPDRAHNPIRRDGFPSKNLVDVFCQLPIKGFLFQNGSPSGLIFLLYLCNHPENETGIPADRNSCKNRQKNDRNKFFYTFTTLPFFGILDLGQLPIFYRTSFFRSIIISSTLTTCKETYSSIASRFADRPVHSPAFMWTSPVGALVGKEGANVERWILLFSAVVRMFESLMQLSQRYGHRYKRKDRKKSPYF